MRAFIFLLSVVFLIVSVSSLQSTTIHVPAEQPTIQAGIDTAVDGDTVLVADGTYTGDGNRDIDFLGKAILVMSENGPENCVVDCEEDGRGFYFHSAEDLSSEVRGFTVMNGRVTNGAGIICGGSSPTIKGNIIKMNRAYLNGGGIYCTNSSHPDIVENTVIWNSAVYGGGLYCENASCPMVTGNNFSLNFASNDGGGVEFVTNCHASFESNIVIGNTAGVITGGVGSAYSSHPTISGNLIAGNHAKDIGGLGIAYNSTPTVVGNTIIANSADSTAGGVGIGIIASLDFERNTIIGNTAGTRAGGIQLVMDVHLILNNSILWGNEAPLGNEVWVGSEWGGDSSPSSLTISYSDVEGGETSIDVDEGCILNWLDGMIDEEPLFVLSAMRDCRLLWESPCIDAGHLGPQYNDPDGTRCDMGAHFFNQDDYLTVYVTPDAPWVNPGGQLGVTYTAINRWDQPESFWALSQVLLPGGAAVNVMGPDRFTLPGNNTVQVHLNHPVPMATPVGVYEYWSRIGVLPPELYDEDSFTFWVID